MKKKGKGINAFFYALGKQIVKYRWVIVALIIVCNLIAFYGLSKANFASESDDDDFIKQSSIYEHKLKYEEIFGNNEFVAILLESDDVFSYESLSIIKILSEDLEQNVSYADKVVSLTNTEITRSSYDEIIAEDLIPGDIPTDPDELADIKNEAFSKEFFLNALFSDDAKQTWITVKLLPFPKKDELAEGETWEDPLLLIGNEVNEILAQDVYTGFTAVEGNTLRAVGKPVKTVEEIAFYSKEASKLLMLAFAMCVLILIVFLRSAKGVIVPLFSTFSAIIIVLGAMGLLGIKIESSMITIPIFLGLAVSIGYSIHIFNFFKRSFLLTGKRKESVYYAVKETGWAILFTALTTFGSLLSFCFIPIDNIKWVGYTSSSIIMTIFFIVITLTPALLSIGKDKEVKDKKEVVNKKFVAEKLLLKTGEMVLTKKRIIMIIFAVIMVLSVVSVQRVRINTDLIKIMGLKVPLVKKLHYVANSKVGAIGGYNIMLDFKETDKIKEPEVLYRFEQLIAEVEKLKLTKNHNSVLKIIKDMNKLFNNNDPAYFTVPNDKNLIAQLLLLYEMAGGTEAAEWLDNDYSILRLNVTTNDYNIDQMEKEYFMLKEKAAEIFPDAEFSYTGGDIEAVLLYKHIAKGELISFLIALGIIGALMILVFMNLKVGLIALIPNLAPVLVVGGIMGVFKMPLDLLTMTIVPMILGIAVDDTIHFITHIKKEFQERGNYRVAILETFRTVGKSIFMTTMILSGTFIIYLFSIGKVFNNFGVLTAAGLLAALLTDYLVTPILIYWIKPFGKETEEDVTVEEVAKEQILENLSN